MLLSAERDQAATNVKTLDGQGTLVGNKYGFLVTEVNAEERMLQVSGCRCLGR